MKPSATQVSDDDEPHDDLMPTQPEAISTAPGPYSTSNRRAIPCPVQWAYPWLLLVSTSLAGLFCLMYITKPVMLASSSAKALTAYPDKPTITNVDEPKSAAAPAAPNLMPSANRLPGESQKAAARPVLPHPAADRSFEETNLRVQHILTAETPDGLIARIDIDVPVIYQSRNLRWTAAEVAEARALLIRLANYQEKSQMLRAEGVDLRASWNRLVGSSIPVGDLRADSPTLLTNQQDAAATPRQAGMNSMESIQIQPSSK